MKTHPRYLFIIFLVIILFLIASGIIYCKLFFSYEKKAFIMSTPVRVKVNGCESFFLVGDALERIKAIDRIFSKFNPSSEVSLINKLAGSAPLQVSRDTFEVLNLASRISGLTDGAFDITLGYTKDLILDAKLRKVYLRKKGIKIDLGGIGKGFAVESARKLLLKKGAKSGIIDMHSSIAVFGPRTWKVGIQHPRDKNKLIGTVELRDGQSLATSGDYERGKHILDPRTGKPAAGCQAVTIMGKDAAEADALSTAVFVLGSINGMRLIESFPGIEGMIVDAEGKIVKSSGMVLECSGDL